MNRKALRVFALQSLVLVLVVAAARQAQPQAPQNTVSDDGSGRSIHDGAKRRDCDGAQCCSPIHLSRCRGDGDDAAWV